MNSRKTAFSLVELLVSIIVISLILTSLAPVLSKKLKSGSVSLAQTAEITTECSSGGDRYSAQCELCTKQYCIKCGIDSCASNQFLDTKKCECKNCSDLYGATCASCDKDKCKTCISGYYMLNGACTTCPAGKCCDGAVVLTTIPTGYVCKDAKLKKCTDVYNSYCSSCNETNCLGCNSYYYLSGNNCISCNMTACTQCASQTYCTACQGDWILNTSTHKCDATCISKMTGCYTCTSASKCTNCHGGYFLNSSNTCSSCSVNNCQKCSNGKSSAICETCKAGYYLLGGACYACSSKYGTNCSACNATECTSCASGYHLGSNTTGNSACVNNDNKFGCSDSNFMQIGNLCVTRKNMGDTGSLTIPSTITVVEPNEYCYSTNSKCCWRGATANQSACDANNGGYSGCSRTVCNWGAANEICAKFNYQGKTWRLPTNNEMKNWYASSIGLGANGLQLCDLSAGYSSARCALAARCPGSYNGNCSPHRVWSGQVASTLISYGYYLYSGVWYGPGTGFASYAFSVRCVTDIE